MKDVSLMLGFVISISTKAPLTQLYNAPPKVQFIVPPEELERRILDPKSVAASLKFEKS